ncbi:hypothetical protein L6164_033453 [Bauhinia variegata]|uniref:Uncharacterized protein n=1 Tax=Bauhinia variegata TaxID=167791 RepID=A0ACB9KRQ0_BAUVA|nr:hypothetical protein L6164_033453 [Bauhinia variegata]
MIGLAREIEGLYHLVAPVMQDRGNNTNMNIATVNKSKAVNKLDLKHFCFGHTSFDRIKPLIVDTDGISYNPQIPCDICHIAKQGKLPLLVSTSISNKPFDLVHMNIWGPTSTTSLDGHRYFLTIVDDYSSFT